MKLVEEDLRAQRIFVSHDPETPRRESVVLGDVQVKVFLYADGHARCVPDYFYAAMEKGQLVAVRGVFYD